MSSSGFTRRFVPGASRHPAPTSVLEEEPKSELHVSHAPEVRRGTARNKVAGVGSQIHGQQVCCRVVGRRSDDGVGRIGELRVVRGVEEVEDLPEYLNVLAATEANRLSDADVEGLAAGLAIRVEPA